MSRLQTMRLDFEFIHRRHDYCTYFLQHQATTDCSVTIPAPLHRVGLLQRPRPGLAPFKYLNQFARRFKLDITVAHS